MPAYVIGRLKTKDWSWLSEYGPLTAALIEKHGGRYLARGGELGVLEGDAPLPDAYVVLEFPSMEQARAWHADPDYAPMIELRRAHSEIELTLVEGIPAAASSG